MKKLLPLAALVAAAFALPALASSHAGPQLPAGVQTSSHREAGVAMKDGQDVAVPADRAASATASEGKAQGARASTASK